MKKIVISLMVSGLLIGCTANDRARRFGGTQTITIPAGEQFVNATWKEVSLWYITKPRESGHVATTYVFQENSAFGIIEGKVLFVEAQ